MWGWSSAEIARAIVTGAADLVMDRAEDTIHLLYNGTSWVQVGGGNNRA